VKHHYYDGVAIFRVVPNFMAQFGISPYPAVAKAWTSGDQGRCRQTRQHSGAPSPLRGKRCEYADDAGVLSISRTTRSSIRNGFAAFGEVTEGMDVVDQLYSGYGDSGAPDQGKMTDEGRAYTEKNFTKWMSSRRCSSGSRWNTVRRPRQRHPHIRSSQARPRVKGAQYRHPKPLCAP